LLRDLGAGADIVSGGELARTRVAGIPANDVVFSGVGKTRAELLEAVHAGVCLINVESSDEVRLLGQIAMDLGVVANCGIRVNPDVTTDTHPYTQTGEHGMKFGVPSDEIVPMAQWIAEHPHLALRGIGMHIGSQITNADNYRDGAKKLAALVDRVIEAGVDGLEWLGVGGGLGIRYVNERALPAEEFAAAVGPLHAAFGLPLALEPGRFLVGGAGYLLTKCVYRKRSGSRDSLIVDAGMNDLIRPSLYGAAHQIRVIEGRNSGEIDDSSLAGRFDVVGPICESGDFLGRDCDGFSMSSNYNSRPRAAEVLVDGTDWRVVRQRETIDDLMRGEELNESMPAG
jgi:diaminopimelate decarboxylase